MPTQAWDMAPAACKVDRISYSYATPRETLMNRKAHIGIAAAPLAWALALLALLPAAARAGRNDPPDTPDMRVVLTVHYRIHTDLDDDLADDLSKRMDAMYGEYERRFASFKTDEGERPRLEAYLFRSQDQYLKFTDDKLKNTGGVYMPHRNLLAAFLDGQGRDGLRRTLQHEAFHQFAFNNISTNLPVWLNEGLAQMFEEGIWTGNSFWIGQAPPRRIRQLKADMDNQKIIDFQDLLALTPEQWAANLTGDHDLGATQYNQSWAMVYFLVLSKGPDGKEKYRARLLNMLRMLHDGKDGDEAFHQAFSANIRGFQDRFTEWAAGFKATDEATMIERQSVLGDLLYELQKRGKKFPDFFAFKRSAVSGGYRMHYAKGELQLDTDTDLRVYFDDIAGQPLSPNQLRFEKNSSAPLPDIVCRCPSYQLRTRFYQIGDKVEHEVLIEAPGK